MACGSVLLRVILRLMMGFEVLFNLLSLFVEGVHACSSPGRAAAHTRTLTRGRSLAQSNQQRCR